MMSYDLFKSIFAERIKSYMPPGYEEYNVSIRTTLKVNQKSDCLNLIPPKDGSMAVSPNIYFSEIYKEFSQTQDMSRLLKKTALLIDYVTKNFKSGIVNVDYEMMKNNIVVHLINAERNKELLDVVPHKTFLDLAIIYRFIIQDGEQMEAVLIDHDLLKDLLMNEKQLYELAIENTKRIFPIKVQPLDEVDTGFDAEEGKMVQAERDDPSYAASLQNGARTYDSYMISNSAGINGATSILFEEFLFSLAKELKSNFFVLPTSIHEVIAVSDLCSDLESMRGIIETLNATIEEQGELLSNHVYHYNMYERKLSIPKIS